MQNIEQPTIKEFDHKQFLNELSELCRKYNLENCIFSGEYEDGKMIGYSCIEREGIGFNQKNLVNSAFNAARMYQSMREQIFIKMDGKR